MPQPEPVQILNVEFYNNGHYEIATVDALMYDHMAVAALLTIIVNDIATKHGLSKTEIATHVAALHIAATTPGDAS
jgi:hypothetical protein